MYAAASAGLSCKALREACKANRVPCAQRATKAVMIAALQKIFDDSQEQDTRNEGAGAGAGGESEEEKEEDDDDDERGGDERGGERGDRGAGGLEEDEDAEEDDAEEEEEEDLGGLDDGDVVAAAVARARRRSNATVRRRAITVASRDGEAGDRYNTGPRPLSRLAQYPAGMIPLFREGALVDTFAAAELLTAERYENEGKFLVVSGVKNRKNRLRLSAGCSCRNGTCGKTTWTARSVKEGMYICSEYRPFTCTGITPSSQALGSTAYSVEMLAPVVTVAVAANPKITAKAIAALLAAYVRRELTNSFISRVKKFVLKPLRAPNDGEDPDANGDHFTAGKYGVGDLPVLKAALQARGWLVNYVTMSSLEMQAELLRIAKDAHAVQQALVKVPGDRVPFDPRTVETLVDEGPDVRYVTAYSLSPPGADAWTKHAHRWSMSDFAHARTGAANLMGTIGARLFQDANNSLADVAIVRCLGNEDMKAWLMLNAATERACPNYDEDEQIDAHDGQKGATSAHKQSFKKAKEVRDKRHRKDNIAARAASKGGGQAACEFYEQAFRARTLEELAAIKATFPPLIAEYLNQISDEMQYPAGRGGWWGHAGSSPAESHNAAMADLREAPFVGGLLTAAENIARRYRKRKQEALNHKGNLPPRIEEQVSKSRSFAMDYIPPPWVTISDDGLTAMVKSTKTAAQYRVTFANICHRRDGPETPTACDKGCCVGEIVCAHVFAAARAKGVEIHTLMNPRDTTVGWQAQYAHSVELPCTAASTHCLT